VNVLGWRCAACDRELGVTASMPWRCPAAGDDPHHVLVRVRALAPFRPNDHPNPFVRFDTELAWAAHADAHGVAFDDRVALVESVDAQVASVAGTGFTVTPFDRSRALSDALGFARDGGVFVKDETGNVAGSHKARHLMPIVLHLEVCERLGLDARRPLAIASCGNAARAAAVLAAATGRDIDVFVPPHADPAVLADLERLGARVTICPRREGDPPGDPCVHRFREAVRAGAIPFTVQGPENALCLDGGRTIGWEIIEGLGHALDRVFVQVGGGALAACVALAAADEGIHPRLHAVQTAGCAPLARAVERSAALGGARAAAKEWSSCMWPWETTPVSAATGILDEETYDWVGVAAGIEASGGSAIVVEENEVLAANELACAQTGITVSHTGTAGLAGLLHVRDEIDDGERVAVLFTGRAH
jgi:threonine dehydratase